MTDAVRLLVFYPVRLHSLYVSIRFGSVAEKGRTCKRRWSQSGGLGLEFQALDSDWPEDADRCEPDDGVDMFS